MKIAIYGSCVSRDTCEFLEGAQVVAYVARQSVASLINPFGETDLDLNRLKSKFQRKMVAGDLIGDAVKRITASAHELDLILIDLIDERRGIWNFPDGTYVTNSIEFEITGGHDWAISKNAELVQFGTDRHFQIWQKGFKKLVDELQNAGVLSKTILINPEWAATVEGSENTMTPTITASRTRWWHLQKQIRTISKRPIARVGAKQPNQTNNRTTLTPTKTHSDRAIQANRLYRRYRNYASQKISSTISRGHYELQIGANHRWGAQPFHYRDEDYVSLAQEIVAVSNTIENQNIEPQSPKIVDKTADITMNNEHEKRYIRLKEWGIARSLTRQPKHEYIEQSNGSLEDRPFEINTNTEGYIKTGNLISDAGARRKVVLIGDSFVESLFAKEESRFPSVLERDLDSAGLNLQVWNGGYSGATALHVNNTLLNKVFASAAYIEKVLIFTSLSDASVLGAKNTYWTNQTLYTPIIDFTTKSSVANSSNLDFNKTEMLFSTMLTACRGMGLNPLVVLTPHLRINSNENRLSNVIKANFSSFEKYRYQTSIYDGINQAATAAAHAVGVAALNGFDAFGDETNEYFYDVLHLNESGHAIFGHWLASQLVSDLKEQR